MEVLDVNTLSKSFGGIHAVDGLEFSVDEDEIVGLIGPNGSGKTTTFNLITGFLKPDSGKVTFDGQEITNAKPYSIAKMGLGRTFQINRPFGRLTVFENMLVPNIEGSTYSAETEEQIWSILEELDIDHIAYSNANELSGGQKQLLELARVLMLDPKFILLDEPAAGVNPALMDDIIDRIKRLNERGKTFLVVEHDMSVVRTLCERIIVMDSGRKIATGSFDEIQHDAKVKEAYLG
ncbi:ABC transporter ATP-binding protein [Natronorarus salvus]|uniref:ABC transporter ATP-binding protein n=1 Tax=Natronorarus salvus TaxID=3117733 RepID=UPI002F265DDA